MFINAHSLKRILEHKKRIACTCGQFEIFEINHLYDR